MLRPKWRRHHEWSQEQFLMKTLNCEQTLLVKMFIVSTPKDVIKAFPTNITETDWGFVTHDAGFFLHIAIVINPQFSSVSSHFRHTENLGSHYTDVTMRAMTSQTTGFSIVYSTVCRSKKTSVTRKILPFDDVIMDPILKCHLTSEEIPLWR